MRQCREQICKLNLYRFILFFIEILFKCNSSHSIIVQSSHGMTHSIIHSFIFAEIYNGVNLWSIVGSSPRRPLLKILFLGKLISSDVERGFVKPYSVPSVYTRKKNGYPRGNKKCCSAIMKIAFHHVQLQLAVGRSFFALRKNKYKCNTLADGCTLSAITYHLAALSNYRNNSLGNTH